MPAMSKCLVISLLLLAPATHTIAQYQFGPYTIVVNKQTGQASSYSGQQGYTADHYESGAGTYTVTGPLKVTVTPALSIARDEAKTWTGTITADPAQIAAWPGPGQSVPASINATFNLTYYDYSGPGQDKKVTKTGTVKFELKGIKAKVTGPDSIELGTEVTFRASEQFPSGGTYEWAVPGPQKHVRIVGPSNGSSVTVKTVLYAAPHRGKRPYSVVLRYTHSGVSYLDSVKFGTYYNCFCGGVSDACGYCKKKYTRESELPNVCISQDLIDTKGHMCCRNPKHAAVGACTGPDYCWHIATDDTQPADGSVADYLRLGAYCGGSSRCVNRPDHNWNYTWLPPTNRASCIYVGDCGSCGHNLCVQSYSPSEAGTAGCHPGTVGTGVSYDTRDVDLECALYFSESCACLSPCTENGRALGKLPSTFTCGKGWKCFWMTSIVTDGKPCGHEERPCFCSQSPF